MTRRLFKSDTLTLLLFAAISAGGPGLHHAPFFNIHQHHACGEENQAHSCGCTHETNGINGADDGSFTNLLHTDCTICQYFASGKAPAPAFHFEMHEAIASCKITPVLRKAKRFAGGFLARGPPVA